jgi:hypothetical protein
MPEVTNQVTVHKAGLALIPNESVAQYARLLADKAREHFVNKLSIVKGKADVYVCEIYSTSVIVEVYKYEETDPKNRSKIFASTYKRKEDGSFEFDATQEVMRVVRYESVSQVSKGTSLLLPELVKRTSYEPAPVAKSAPEPTGVFRGIL